MAPIWLRTSQGAVEIGTAVAFAALGAVIANEAIKLGPGWGEQGPQAGFFPFVLSAAIIIGAIFVVVHAFANPEKRPFFEVSQEIVDLLKVGIPVAFAVAAIRWAGLYITAGVYLGFFMAWYGRFRWWQALAGAVLLPFVMWLVLSRGFAIPMPMSIYYRTGQLPI